MVEISYCPKCKTAVRMHLMKRVFCKKCLEEYKNIEVQRSRYFIIQLPLIIFGIVFFIYALWIIVMDSKKIAEIFGNAILAMAFLLFALGFQIKDSKCMEEDAVEIGRRKYPVVGDEMDGHLIYKPERSMITGLPVRASSKLSKEQLLNQPTKFEVVKRGDSTKRAVTSNSRTEKMLIQKSLTSFNNLRTKKLSTGRSRPRKIRKAQ